MSEREAVIQEALTWIGTPHVHEARVKGAGVDCGQFLAAVFHAAGLVPEITVEQYPHDWHLHRDEEKYLNIVERFSVPTQLRLPGNIVMFRYGRCLSHGGIILEWPRIIHAYIGRGVTIDDVEANVELSKRFAGIWTLKRWAE